MKTTLVCSLALCLLCACGSTNSTAPAVANEGVPVEIAPRGELYLQGGPTTTVDVMAAQPEPTTLRLLEEKSQALLLARKELGEWQARAQKAESQIAQGDSLADQKSQEIERLQTLLASALADQKELSEALLTSRIQVLKLEQQLIKGKLADLAKAGGQ